MTVIERWASFHGTCDGDPLQGRVRLVYFPDRPLNVYAVFVGGDGCTEWTIGRDLLARRQPGRHEIGVRAEGIWTVLRLISPDGTADLRMVTAEVDAFLAATARAVPYGDEVVDVDTALDALLKDGAR